jgi:hypothetical protein
MLDQLRASLQARRAEMVDRVQAIERALGAYRKSAEAKIAHDFAVQHALSRPKLEPLSPRQAAERLYRLVVALPELEHLARTESHESAATPPAAQASTSTQLEPCAAVETQQLPALQAHCADRRLVVIGALAGRRKTGAFPQALEARTEWVDTERDGVHAIGNLPQRIRQGRVGAIVILDKLVQHKHTDPVIAAARESHTPVAFAGKGGRASLLRALTELDERLNRG